MYLFYGTATANGSGVVSITLPVSLSAGVQSLTNGNGGPNITEWTTCSPSTGTVTCTATIANSTTGAPTAGAQMWYQIIGN
jgi:hypothetical protein